MAQVKWLAQQVGFPDPSLAVAVAWAESGGNPSALGDNGDSVGLWQINMPSHPEYTRDVLLNPIGNVKAAFAISQQGRDWSPWTTFRTGAWQAFYQQAQASAVPA